MDLIITVSTWLPDDTAPTDVREAIKQEAEAQSARLTELGRIGSVTVEVWKANNEPIVRATQQVVQQDAPDTTTH